MSDELAELRKRVDVLETKLSGVAYAEADVLEAAMRYARMVRGGYSSTFGNQVTW